MKQLIPVLGILLFSFFAKSQTYKPFNFDNGEWYCVYYTQGGMFGGGHDSYYATDTVRFFCAGDTLINDTAYKKLYYEGYTSSQIVSKTYISGYYGAVRNDTAKKQVCFNDGNLNYVIYDFNVNAGDSICNNVVYPLPVSFHFCGKVISIDSVYYCGNHFRQYYIDGNQNIIEGIGSDKGLFPVLSSPWYSNLLCYSEQNNSGCTSCNIDITGIVNQTINAESLKIIQANDRLNIFSEYIMKSIELVDLSGRSVFTDIRIDSYNADLRITQKGIYILRVKTDDKILVRKIIVK